MGKLIKNILTVLTVLAVIAGIALLVMKYLGIDLNSEDDDDDDSIFEDEFPDIKLKKLNFGRKYTDLDINI